MGAVFDVHMKNPVGQGEDQGDSKKKNEIDGLAVK
jgi:hypothetical protein